MYFCLFEGTGFQQLSSYAQGMALAMMESPIKAIRQNLRMRGIREEGTRPQLIVQICSQYDSNREASLGNRDNSNSGAE